MKRIHIDFASPSLRRTLAMTSTMTWLFGAAALALCVGASFAAWTAIQQYQAREATLNRVQRQIVERNARQAIQKPSTISASQVSAVNRAIAQLNLPWRDVFDAIEAATPATIALLSLEPDAKKHVAKGLAEAKNSDAMIAYIEQLKKQAFFQSVVLTKHEINEQDTNRPIRFQFEAQWTGGAE